MGSQLVQTQWSLNETSNSVYGLTRGILEAATSDNVQPLAIMACEQFGNTLAISRETRRRIETTVLPTPEPITLQFLKAKVGFKKHDCAVQLGSNQAGLRFISLAAALISSIEASYCAEALMLMLEETTSDTRLLPTTRHLRELMSSLEARCRRSGFADTVLGYNSIITGTRRANGDDVHYRATHIPDSKGLAALVDACRHLQRVTDDELSSVEVEAGDCAAWVAAFAKWSLEVPPSIYSADGTPIISQPGSQLNIRILAYTTYYSSSDAPNMRITKRYKLDSIRSLVTQFSSHNDSNYRVGIQTYGNTLREFIGDKRDSHIIFTALPLAIKLVRERIRSDPGLVLSSTSGLGNGQDFAVALPNTLPDNDVIFGTISLTFGLEPDFPFQSLASLESFRDLPEVDHCFLVYDDQNKFGVVKSDLLRTPWWRDSSLSERYVAEPHRLILPDFIWKLSDVCSSILALSLFYNVEGLYFNLPSWFATHPEKNDLSLEIYGVLRGKDGSINNFDMKIERKLNNLLLNPIRDGSLIDDEGKRTIVSSSATHVFWLSILDNLALGSNGYRRITSIPGRLIHGRETYNNIWPNDIFRNNIKDTKESYELPVSAAQNIFSNLKTQWNLSDFLGILRGDLSLIDRRKPKTELSAIDPLQTLEMMASSILMPSWRYLDPCGAYEGEYLMRQGQLNIFPTGGVGELQFYCLGWLGMEVKGTSPRPVVVVRQRACFDCCVASSS
ncbi:hypothetical protein NUW58_g3277 [Xylaria curta]|uniref:Uncharacterized protein n=1 Tax=Xylaria curta TaxID=42375 RepID=A0ACC1PCA2_9PEZI|nr:hypothetical protein NUW58_g3277 [Xylaria curta]